MSIDCSLPEAMTIARVSRGTIFNWMRRGALRPCRRDPDRRRLYFLTADVLRVARVMRPEPDVLFWSKVEKLPGDGCWLWRGNCPGGRYGHVKIAGRTELAHRYSYEMNVDIVPDGLWVLHRCDTPRCVRPDHLFVGTPSDNVVDKMTKGRGGFGQLHGQSVLTEARVRHIRRRAAQGFKYGEVIALARRYGVSRQRIWQAATRRTWRRLDAAA